MDFNPIYSLNARLNTTVLFFSEVNCTTDCPTLQEFPTEWSLWLLVSLYSIIFLLSLGILLSSFRQGCATFKTNFLILQTIGSGLRVLYFSAALPWTYLTLILFYLLTPIYLQFVTVSLLIIFLWKCIFSITNNKGRINAFLYPVAGISFALLGVMCVVYAFLVNKFRFVNVGGEDRMCAIYAAGMYALISLLLCVSAHRSYKILKRLSLSDDKLRKVSLVKLVFGFHIVVFMFRFAWALSYSAGVNLIQKHLAAQQQEDTMDTYYTSVFIFYTVFEVLPSFTVLVMLLTWMPRGRGRVSPEETGVNTPLLAKVAFFS